MKNNDSQHENRGKNRLKGRRNPNIANYGVEFRSKPGQSGNPGGRPKKLPLSEAHAEQLGTALPPSWRRQIETRFGLTLPEEFTFAEAIALKTAYTTLFGKPGESLAAEREMRDAVEGKSMHRVETLEPQQRDTVEDMKKKLWAWFAETEYERCKLFNAPVPEDTIEAAEMLGVPLELPPCQQEQGQNT